MNNWTYSNLPKYSDNWPEISEQCKKRDGYRCRDCGCKSEPGNRLNACHIISKSQGGSDTIENLITKCEKCHSTEKGHSHMKSALKSRNNNYNMKNCTIINIKPL